MNILITGASGFVGSNLITYLTRFNTNIDVLDINQNFDNNIRNVFNWNDFNETTFEKYKAVIHLAGKAHDTHNKSIIKSYFDINVGLTKRIFNKFLDSQSECFILFSSVKAAADVVNREVLYEDVTPAPVGPYGVSKLMAEEYILNFLKAGDDRLKDKRVYILRPCMIHGPGNKGNLNLLYSIVKKGIPWPLGAYENKRSFCFIDNITYVVEQLILRNNIESGIYNVGDDEPLSTNELIRLISQSVEKKSRIIYLSKGLINSMASFGSLLHLPLNRERLRKLTDNYVVSNAKIKQALNIEKMPVTAFEGMTKTLASFDKL